MNKKQRLAVILLIIAIILSIISIMIKVSIDRVEDSSSDDDEEEQPVLQGTIQLIVQPSEGRSNGAG